MKVFFGEQTLPDGVVSYHLLPTLTLIVSTGDKSFAAGHRYSLTVSFLIWGVTTCFGK